MVATSWLSDLSVTAARATAMSVDVVAPVRLLDRDVRG